MCMKAEDKVEKLNPFSSKSDRNMAESNMLPSSQVKQLTVFASDFSKTDILSVNVLAKYISMNIKTKLDPALTSIFVRQ